MARGVPAAVVAARRKGGALRAASLIMVAGGGALLASSGRLAFLGFSRTAPLSPTTRSASRLASAAVDEKVAAWEKSHIVDEDVMLNQSTFPIKPDELIQKTITFLAYNNGCDKPELLDEDFEFAGPVVGPLSKQRFIEAFSSFRLQEAFPDANYEMHHFRVDPFEPSRVWFTNRGKGTNIGATEGSPLLGKPTGKGFVNPPQACSVRFNEKGLVNQYTVGYVMDRRLGNTGGLGGVYGIMYAIGKPFPFREAQPWKKSFRYTMFQKFADFMQNRQKKQSF